jgi:manganese transport protein
MDPGNWATDIAGGSHFGYTLLWVLVMSNLIALLLQSLSARLGLVRGLDLAQASRLQYPRAVTVVLYILAELAIAATDLAEVLGMAIGLSLLTGMPLLWGVLLTLLDTFLLLTLIQRGMRKMEAFIIALVAVIGIAFVIQIILAQPSVGAMATGLIPSIPNTQALYIAIGIIGATVMPHNLYLHSALVQSRKIDRSPSGLREAIKFNVIDSAIALNLALFVNAAILIVAAATFATRGMQVTDITQAHQLLAPLLGSKLAPILFAIALIAAGQSSTLTGTLAGQVVMEGYLNLRIQPWLRRVLTRAVAVVPAVIVILTMGEGAVGDLLVLSQVILSLQLGYAIIPLITFVSDREQMGEFTIGMWTRIGAWLATIIIVALNVKLVIDTITEAIADPTTPGFIGWITVPVSAGLTLLLLYIAIMPWWRRTRSPLGSVHEHTEPTVELAARAVAYQRVAVTVDFSSADQIALDAALATGGANATYVLIHVVETAGARVFGSEIRDRETSEDERHLQSYAATLRTQGYSAESQIGFGSPKQVIPQIVEKTQVDLLVMGAHGHRMLGDIVFGSTIDAVRHRIDVPVLVVKEGRETT